MKTGVSWPSLVQARARVLGIQTKLHRWATDDPECRFDDLFNLVCDPAFLVMAWDRVRRNTGARSAGVDGRTVRTIESEQGVAAFLNDLRDDLKARTFKPLPVREVMIPKPGTSKRRRLGIPTVRDRVTQATLKLVLEPIFEAGFRPCSYGFRPERRTHDAVAEVRYLTSRSYEWVVDADIEACFDEIAHPALMARVRNRIGDKRVLALIKAFLKAGILSEDAVTRDSDTGTPQGGILSPLLANIALSAVDDHFAQAWDNDMATSRVRQRRRRHGFANYRLIRYADDLVLVVTGTKADAERLQDELAAVLAPIGLRLSERKTRVCHIDEGLDFLGWRIQRHRSRKNPAKRYVYTRPSKTALERIKRTVKQRSRTGTNQPFKALLHQLNAMLRGWTNYFRHGVSSAAFRHLSTYVWRRVVGWLRRKHPKASWKQIRRRHLDGWWPRDGAIRLFDPTTVATIWYRYRGTAIATPWPLQTQRSPA